MCGGTNYSRFEPPRPGWNTFWGCTDMPSSDVGLFIEVVRGCSNSTCRFQCQAQDGEEEHMEHTELHRLLSFLNEVSLPQLMYYGMGDASRYKWSNVFGRRKTGLPRGRINLPARVSHMQLKAFWNHGVKVCLQVNTVEEAVLANKRRGRIDRVLVPVATGVEWIEIMKTLATPIEFNSFMPSSSGRYVPHTVFKKRMWDALGIHVAPKVYKLRPGFKPVIEGFKLGRKTSTLQMRRCFQPDSAKLELTVPNGGVSQWGGDSEDAYNKLDEFAKQPTTCSKCSAKAWYYNWECE